MRALDLHFLHSSRYPTCTAVIDKHFEGYMTLQFSDPAGVYVSYEEETHVLKGAWFWPAYPGPNIRFGCAPGVSDWDHRYVAFSGTLAQQWMASGLFPAKPQKAPEGHDYAPLFDELLALVQRTDSWRHAKAINILEGILLDLAIDRAQSSMTEDWLESVIRQISGSSLGFEPDYDAIALSCGMAVSTLRRRFREAMGTPIHSFALSCRSDEARRLLGGTDMPIKSIADMLGYKDVYYFSQQFRKLVGVSPGAYRRSRQ